LRRLAVLPLLVLVTAGLMVGGSPAPLSVFSAALWPAPPTSLPVLRALGPESALAITSFAADPATLTLPNSTYFNVTTRGGISPLSYWYTGLPDGCLTQNTSSLRCQPYAAQLYYVTVTVNDSAHASVSSTLQFHSKIVYAPPPVITAYFVSPTAVVVGQQAIFTVNVTGGTPLISYFFTGLPKGCTSFSDAHLSCVPLAAGSYQVRVLVNDAVGYLTAQTVPFTVTGGSGASTNSTPLLLGSGGGLVGLVAMAAVVVLVAMLLVRQTRRRKPPTV
jgi:hypothetical protein